VAQSAIVRLKPSLVVLSIAAGLIAVGCSRGSRATGDRDGPEFDAPDAALRYARERRAPLRPDIARAYETAADRRSQMARFSSRIGRTLPACAPARLYYSGRGVHKDSNDALKWLQTAESPAEPDDRWIYRLWREYVSSASHK
jgi:hypothetical protein